jgi:hypothetical protein
MNYITLVNNFWSIDLEANFTHLEVHLFFKLLEINNKLGWKESFRFPNSRLEAEIGSRSKNLINARQRLVDFRLITYKKGSTRKAGSYSLILPPEGNSIQLPYLGVTKESNQESNEESNQGSNRKVIRGTLNRQEVDKNKPPISPKPKKPTKNFDLDFVETAFSDLVREFIRYRKQDIKKPFKTERGVKVFYNQLLSLSNNNLSSAQALVKHAKDKEWQTVYPIKKEVATNNQSKNVNDLWNFGT